MATISSAVIDQFHQHAKRNFAGHQIVGSTYAYQGALLERILQHYRQTNLVIRVIALGQ